MCASFSAPTGFDLAYGQTEVCQQARCLLELIGTSRFVFFSANTDLRNLGRMRDAFGPASGHVFSFRGILRQPYGANS
jgi:hypothetical protein